MSDGAFAQTPARAWMGAERVALRCNVSAPLDAADAQALCHAIFREAQAMSSRPLRLIAAGEPSFDDELIIDLTIDGESARPDQVALSARGVRTGPGAATTPALRPQPLPIEWQESGPRPAGRLRALELFLGSPGSGRGDPRDWDRGE